MGPDHGDKVGADDARIGLLGHRFC
jgi:hypothetical protein